jgi:hypothetical protein
MLTGLIGLAGLIAKISTKANNWRIRELVDQGGGFLGASEVKFLQTVGDAAQPGAGAASGTAASIGSPAAAFDLDLNTEYVAAYAGDGSTFLQYSFTQALGHKRALLSEPRFC